MLTVKRLADVAPEVDLIEHTFKKKFFLKVFGGHMSFFGATGTPVLDFW